MGDARKIAVIGAGHVGSHVAMGLLAQDLCSRLVLLDIDEAKARAQADDLQDAAVLAPGGARVWAGDYRDLADAGFAVVCAGSLLVCEDRLQELSASLEVMDQIIPGLRGCGFGGILLVITNPVDLTARYLSERLGLPWGRVLGSGTTLDSCRLVRELSRRTGTPPAAIRGFVVGEHGDSQVPLWSGVTAEGLPLRELAARDPRWKALDREETAEAVRRAGWEILCGKGSTEFGIGAAAGEIIRAVQRDTGRVLPVSVPMKNGVFASLPCALGKNGAERVAEPEMLPEERERFEASCRRLEEIWNQTVEGRKP